VLQIPMNLRQGEAERGAAHEAGHIVVALSLGVTLDKVSRVESAQLPDILQREGFDSSVATDYTDSLHEIEPRRQFLIAVGGMAGENLVLGVYNRKGAAHDIESLKPNILSEAGTRRVD
jgi:hypothetical protein